MGLRGWRGTALETGDDGTRRAAGFDAELELVVDRPPLASARSGDDLDALVLAKGFVARRIELSVHSGERSYLGTVVLAPGAPVSGRVVDSSGQGVPSARVDWVPASALPKVGQSHAVALGEAYEGLELTTLSRADGSFRLPGVPHEPGLLSAFLGDSTGHLVLEAGEARDARIVLPDRPRRVPLRFAASSSGRTGLRAQGPRSTSSVSPPGLTTLPVSSGGALARGPRARAPRRERSRTVRRGFERLRRGLDRRSRR